jgi:hypothetical protein
VSDKNRHITDYSTWTTEHILDAGELLEDTLRAMVQEGKDHGPIWLAIKADMNTIKAELWRRGAMV